MKICLVQSYLGDQEKGAKIFPLGLSYIGTYLKELGYHIDIFDPNIYEGNIIEGVKSKITDCAPDIVGVSLRNIDNVDYIKPILYYKELHPLVAAIKSVACEAILIIGGAGFSMFPEKIMEEVAEIDFGVYLEGEKTIIELLENLNNPEVVKGIFFRKEGKIIFTGERELTDFNSSLTPKRSFFELSRYSSTLGLGIQSKRGCVLNCAYCNYIKLNGKHLRLRSPIKVVDEIKNLKAEFGVSTVIFVDNIFNIPRKHAEQIAREIIKRKLSINWSAWFDLKNFDEHLAELCIEAGCNRMAFSPDGASENMLSILKKNFSMSDVDKVLIIAKKYPSIDFRFTMFCALPNQTILDTWRIIILYFRTHVMLRNSKCLISWVRILPYTQMNSYWKNGKNLLPHNSGNLRNYFYQSKLTKYLVTPLFRFLIIPFFSCLRKIRKKIDVI
jgi:radical SAM superfamily enzyme YgiQ (UPF0313 family)